MNYVNIYGKSPLHVAAEKGKQNVWIVFNSGRKNGFYILGDEKIVNLLVRGGANANLVSGDGLTALQYAVNKGISWIQCMQYIQMKLIRWFIPLRRWKGGRKYQRQSRYNNNNTNDYDRRND